MNFIHPTAIIDTNVKLGTGNYVGPFCYITGNTVIGNNNRFEAYCSVGTRPEHRDYFDRDGETRIGDNNTFREFITINSGTIRATVVGSNVIMLRNSHIGHDSIVEDGVNFSCNALVGGHSYVMEGANFGLGSICHQFSKIGAYAMIGMGAIITKKSAIEPCKTYVGNPAKLLKINEHALKKYGIDSARMQELEQKYHSLTN